MSWRSVLLVFGCLGVLQGCGTGREGEVGSLGLGLTMPLASVEEIRSVGLFALSATPPDLECEPYLLGEMDPLSELPEHMVAMRLIDVPQGEAELSVSLGGISPGGRTILVECYDAGGSRIYLGCGQTEISAGQAAELLIDMVEDPVASDPPGSGG